MSIIQACRKLSCVYVNVDQYLGNDLIMEMQTQIAHISKTTLIYELHGSSCVVEHMFGVRVPET